MINIRRANESDLKTLCSLGAITFRETYGDANSDKDMDDYISEAFNEKAVLGEIEDENSKFFIVSLRGNDVGYFKTTESLVPEELGGKRAIELQRMYVLGKHIGQGIGKKLMERCFEEARNDGFDVVWTQVWGDMYDKNLKAIEFYKNWGFEPFARRTFTIGESVQDDVLMKKEIG